MFKPVFLRRLAPRPVAATLMTGAFVAAFNHVMRGQELTRQLRALSGKRISICVTGWPWALEMVVEEGRLRIAERGKTAHVTFRGSLADLHRLATRSEDPDTLFFERRLCIEGETQTGLLIKNLLDALEWDWEAHVQAVLAAPAAELAILAGRRLHRLRPERPVE